MNGCGTTTSLSQPSLLSSNLVEDDNSKSQMKTGFSNIIIIQMDEEVQEVWDSARKINCEWVNLIQKRVEFEPFEVEMLDFEEVKFEGDSVDCWMDLQVGKYPDSEEIHSAVKIGEQLSMLVYAKDNEDMYDMHIKECYAYSSENYDNTETVKLQLTDERGCVMKNKLLDGFYTRREAAEDGGTNIVAYGYLSAFKFPDVLDVFTTCEVEICKGGCNDKCDDDDEEHDRTLSQFREDDETTTEPYREGVELFGELISCDDPQTAKVDPRCRQPKALDDDEPDCENELTDDPRCPVDCVTDPLNARCPPDCLQFTGLDERCPCSADPLHHNCPPDCDQQRGVDPRCPCQEDPLHPNCPADCTLYAGVDKRCPCSQLPTHPNCPANCELYTGKDPRCPCEDDPYHPNCPADCKLNAGRDPRCPCNKFPLHQNCLDCNRFRGKDPRCPCSEDPTHKNCPPDCDRFAGQDPRCPCSQFPLHRNCPKNCEKFAGQDPRCPCNKYPFHKNCPPNCVMFTGQDERCPCDKNPFHLNCTPDCRRFVGQDPRCPCSKDPLNPKCPPDCVRFRTKDPRCKPDCSSQPSSQECQDFCQDNPLDPVCEGVELFGQALTTSTRRPQQTTRSGRQEEEHEHHHADHGGHHAEHGHHGHHGGDPRFHAFHSFHYDPGDGRRNRNGKKRLGKRSIDFESDPPRPSNSSGSARLVRHIRVVSPDDDPHFDGGSLDWEHYHGHIRGAVCLSSLTFFSGLTILLGALGLTVFLLTVQCLKHRRRKYAKNNNNSNNNIINSRITTQQHQKLFHNSSKAHFVQYKPCDNDSRLSRLFYIQ